MRRMFFFSLFLCMVSSALSAQKIRNVRSCLEPNCGYYTITFDLEGKSNDLYLLKLVPYLGSSEIVEPRFIEGPGLKSGVAPGKGLQVFWNPILEGADSGNWQFRLDSNKLPWVLVEGCTFHNGTSNVTLSSFYTDKYEVTQAGYQAVMGTNPSYFDGNPNRPVEQVSWFNAIEYCNRRSMQEGLTPCYSYSSYGTNPDDWPTGWNTNYNNHTNVSCNWSANGYRLPTEMEWMFAAKGGNLSQGYTYSGSDTIGDVAWYDSNSGSGTHDVGEKAPNELGTFDMSGNVWEWTWDIYGSYPSGSQTNPTGSDSGSGRVGRGGGWFYNAYNCTVSYRNYYNATYTSSNIGFRCLRVFP